MKSRFIITSAIASFAFFFVLNPTLQSQNYGTKFGEVNDYEMNMTSYPEDSTANAVILLEKGETFFVYTEQSGFRYKFDYQVKIKILKPDGIDDIANGSIKYTNINASSREEVTGLSGTTYNLEDGKIVKSKLSKEYINDEKYDDKYFRKKFTMPAVKVGSIIEYKYTIYSDFFYDLRDFRFQHSIPVVKTSYEITLPEYYVYNVDMRGYEKIESKQEKVNEKFTIRYSKPPEAGLNKTGGTQRYSFDIESISERYYFEGKKIPALKDESFVWCLDDYISKVSFELKSIQIPHSHIKNFSTNWENIDKELMDLSSFGGNLKKTNLFKEIVPEFNDIDDKYTKACKIQDMIKSKVKWDGKDRLLCKDLKEALKTGLGNSADMNFLLINALNAANIDAFPVVMSTRDNGILPYAHPSVSALNYVITGIKIDTVTYFTDASSKAGSLNILPQACLVDRARIIREKGGSEWVDLTKIMSGSIVMNVNCKFEDGIYTANVNTWFKDESAYDFRLSQDKYKNEDEYIEYLESKFTGSVSDYSISDVKNTSAPINEKYTVKTNITSGDDYIYLTAMFDPQFTENRFKSDERKLPINFNYPISFKETVSIEIPEGYTIEELPKSEKITLDEKISCLFQVIKQDNIIVIRYNFTQKEIMFLNTEYEHLKDFFAKVLSKNQEKIILKKL